MPRSRRKPIESRQDEIERIGIKVRKRLAQEKLIVKRDKQGRAIKLRHGLPMTYYRVWLNRGLVQRFTEFEQAIGVAPGTLVQVAMEEYLEERGIYWRGTRN